ncbi:hypothetical protein [Deinococcus sp. AJ005]|uniref:hypothetical protein n=1 Tax=Deinococcus sp. AJ005 TaxID=2652443 RepID=UPI00125CC578|nr:hypothetical protein [Deinococcus sp. AJ005]QFP77811.1 hypothetical protein DAAJ005_16165 [Deinococcus sp. AJ005]
MRQPGLARIGMMLCGLGLAGCGSLGSAPTPLAGDLLNAPTTLNLGRQLLRLTAAPQLIKEADRFSVRVSVEASRPAATDPLKVTGIYVFTGLGLWQSPRLSDFSGASNCSAQVCAWGSGGANGFTAGEDVRVIAQLRDASGKTYWLRDARSQNVVAKPLIR